MNSKLNILFWVLRVLAAGILLQTLFFKFTGHPESIYIFETVGLEPFGRYASGITELFAAIFFADSKIQLVRCTAFTWCYERSYLEPFNSSGN